MKDSLYDYVMVHLVCCTQDCITTEKAETLSLIIFQSLLARKLNYSIYLLLSDMMMATITDPRFTKYFEEQKAHLHLLDEKHSREV